jgi:hypothetical protein
LCPPEDNEKCTLGEQVAGAFKQGIHDAIIAAGDFVNSVVSGAATVGKEAVIQVGIAAATDGAGEVVEAGEAGAAAIRGFTKHGINQAISREGVGVAEGPMMDAVRNPTKLIQQADGAVKYVGKDATVILNKAGKVISTWARNAASFRISP